MMATLATIGTVLAWIVVWAVCTFFVVPVVDWAWQWWKRMPDDWTRPLVRPVVKKRPTSTRR